MCSQQQGNAKCGLCLKDCGLIWSVAISLKIVHIKYCEIGKKHRFLLFFDWHTCECCDGDSTTEARHGLICGLNMSEGGRQVLILAMVVVHHDVIWN